MFTVFHFSIFAWLHGCMLTELHVYTFACLYVCMFACKHVYIFAHVHVLLFLHVHMLTWLNAYMFTWVQRDFWLYPRPWLSLPGALGKALTWPTCTLHIHPRDSTLHLPPIQSRFTPILHFLAVLEFKGKEYIRYGLHSMFFFYYLLRWVQKCEDVPVF